MLPYLGQPPAPRGNPSTTLVASFANFCSRFGSSVDASDAQRGETRARLAIIVSKFGRASKCTRPILNRSERRYSSEGQSHERGVKFEYADRDRSFRSANHRLPRWIEFRGERGRLGRASHVACHSSSSLKLSISLNFRPDRPPRCLR